MFGRIGTLMLGGAIGAGLAMLLAPRTGSETQNQLMDRAQALKDQYGDVLERGRLRMTELMKTGKEMLDEKVQQGQQALGQMTQGHEDSHTSAAPRETGSQTPQQQL